MFKTLVKWDGRNTKKVLKALKSLNEYRIGDNDGEKYIQIPRLSSHTYTFCDLDGAKQILLSSVNIPLGYYVLVIKRNVYISKYTHMFKMQNLIHLKKQKQNNTTHTDKFMNQYTQLI